MNDGINGRWTQKVNRHRSGGVPDLWFGPDGSFLPLVGTGDGRADAVAIEERGDDPAVQNVSSFLIGASRLRGGQNGQCRAMRFKTRWWGTTAGAAVLKTRRVSSSRATGMVGLPLLNGARAPITRQGRITAGGSVPGCRGFRIGARHHPTTSGSRRLSTASHSPWTAIWPAWPINESSAPAGWSADTSATVTSRSSSPRPQARGQPLSGLASARLASSEPRSARSWSAASCSPSERDFFALLAAH